MDPFWREGYLFGVDNRVFLKRGTGRALGDGVFYGEERTLFGGGGVLFEREWILYGEGIEGTGRALGDGVFYGEERILFGGG
jgi:hypothetical protein